jgi:hypothetical protein
MADDFVELGPELRDGNFAAVRERGGVAEPTVIRPAREGEPLPDDAMLLEPTDEPRRYAVTEVRELRGGRGPAQVATEGYRENHDRIFGNQREVGQA